MLLERYLGSWRVLTILLAGCLGGTALTLVFAPDLSLVGISGGVFGLAAGFVYLQWTQREALIAPHRTLHKFLIVGALGFDIFLSSVLPSISLSAHLGGLIVGLALTHLLVGRSAMEPAYRNNLARAVAIALAALFVAGAGTSLVDFFGGDGAEVRRDWVLEQKRRATGDVTIEYEMMWSLLEQGAHLESAAEYRELVGLALRDTSIPGNYIAEMDARVRRNGFYCTADGPDERAWIEVYREALSDQELPSYLNDTAWNCAVDRGASREELELAYQLADEALSMRPGRFTMLDTRARLAYLLAEDISVEAENTDNTEQRAYLEQAMSDAVAALEGAYTSEGSNLNHYGEWLVKFAEACHQAGCDAPGSPGAPAGFRVEARDKTLRIESGAAQPTLLVALDKMSGAPGPSGLIAGCVAPGESIEMETKNEWVTPQISWLSAAALQACPQTPPLHISSDE